VTIRTSDKLDNLANALVAVQRELVTVTKDGKNPHFKSTFATLAAVREACSALTEHGVAFTQITRMPVEGEDAAMVLITRLLHTSGQWMESEYPVRPVKQDPQGLGSALTYARRYALMAIVGIAPEDDDGEAASGRGPQQQQRQAQPRAAQPTEPTQPKDERAKLLSVFNGFGISKHEADIILARNDLGPLDDGDLDAIRGAWAKISGQLRSISRTKIQSSGGSHQYELQRIRPGAWSCNCTAGSHTKRGEPSPCNHAKRAELRLFEGLMGSRFVTVAQEHGGTHAQIPGDQLDAALALCTSWLKGQGRQERAAA